MKRTILTDRLSDPQYVADCLKKREEFSWTQQQMLIQTAANHCERYAEVIETHLCANCLSERQDMDETLCRSCRGEVNRVDQQQHEAAEDDRAHAWAERRAMQ